jgi:hypothetical protein
MKELIMICAVVGLSFATSSFGAPTILLDADTPATGSLLGTQPLVTPFGTITFDGEMRDRNGDPEFNDAGALGDVFDIHNTPIQTAELSFGFSVQSLTFIYGGNFGSILVEARDGSGVVVDSFFQADTSGGQPAGPITLSGSNIRSLNWEDTELGNNFAALDNIIVSPTLPAIDIKPGSCPNPLNVNNKGVLPVAILGLDGFDVTTVDPDSISLEDVTPIYSSYEDVSTPVSEDECACTTEGPDGYLDLTLKFKTQDIVDALGEVVDTEIVSMELQGSLFDGTPIIGSDCVVILKKGND